SGSANEVAVYCIRGVGGPAPQSHSGASRRRAGRRATTCTSSAATTTAATNAARISSGEMVLAIPASRTVSAPLTTSVGTPSVAPVARDRAGPKAAGATASATHAAAATPVVASSRGGDSTACSGARLRARAKNPTPSALTKVATANPAVSATTATATGSTSAVVTPAPAGGCTRDCNSSHSEMNPLPGGSAIAPSAPTA